MANMQGLYYYTKEEADELFTPDFSSEHLIGSYDDKPLYQIAFSTTCGSSANSATVVETLNVTGWVEVISIRGVAHSGSGKIQSYPIGGGDRPCVEIGSDGKVYEIHTASFYNSKPLTVVIEYSKTS